MSVRTADDLPDGVREFVLEGRTAWQTRDYPLARRCLEAALVTARAEGEWFGELSALHFLGNVAFNECRDRDSRSLHVAAFELARAHADNQGIATSLGSIALVDLVEGDFDAAAHNYAAAVAAYERAGMAASARSLRETATKLLDGRVAVETIVHREGLRSRVAGSAPGER
jgi:hypothetical protein